MLARTPAEARRSSCQEPSLGLEVDDNVSVAGGVAFGPCGLPVAASTLPLGVCVVVV